MPIPPPPSVPPTQGDDAGSIWLDDDTPVPSYSRHPPGVNPVDDFSASPQLVVQGSQELTSGLNALLASNANQQSLVHSQSGLHRSLHIPSRRPTVSSGFSLPDKLASCGVTTDRWKAFQREIRGYGKLSGEQWLHNLVWAGVAGVVLDLFLPGSVVLFAIPISYITRKDHEQSNFVSARASGRIQTCLDSWNATYFEALGLHATIAVPHETNIDNADVSKTKLFKYQQKRGVTTRRVGQVSGEVGWRERRYAERERVQKIKFARRGRIVILPLELVPVESRALTPTLGEPQEPQLDFGPPPSPPPAWKGKEKEARGENLMTF